MPPRSPPTRRGAGAARAAPAALLAVAETAGAQKVVADEQAFIAPKVNDAGRLEIGVIRRTYAAEGETWSPAADTVIHTRGSSQTQVPAWTEGFPEIADAFGPVGAPIWLSDPREADPASVPTALIGFTRALLGRDRLLAPSGSAGTLLGVSTIAAGGRAIRFSTVRPAVGATPTSATILFDSARATPDPLWAEGSGAFNTSFFQTSWVFRAAGFYCLDVEVRGTLATGVRSIDRRGIAVAVGDVDAQQAPACPTPTGGNTETRLASSTGVPNRMIRTGTEVTLTADVAPSGVPGTVRFLDDDGSGSGEQPLGDPVAVDPDAGTATLTTDVLGPGLHTLRAEFTPTDSAYEPSSGTFGPMRVYRPGHFVLEVGPGERVHADVAARTEGDRLRLRLSVDNRGLGDDWPAIDDAVLVIPEPARRQVPPPAFGLDHGFLGAPGSDVWMIGLVQEAGIPWLGVSSESIVDSAYRHYTTWRLDGVSGIDGGPPPGEFVLWDSPQGDKPFFSTRIGTPDAVRMLARASGHWHANWTFTTPGIYCLNMSVANRAAADGAPVGDHGVLTVIVGDEHDGYRTESCAERGVRPQGVPPAVAPDRAPAGRTHVLDSEIATPSRAFATFTPRIVGGALDVDLVEGSDRGGGVAYDPEDVIVRLGASARGTIGDADAGAGPRVPWAGEQDQQIWEIEESTEGHSRYNLGWSTLGIDPGQVQGDLTWRLTGVQGPGEFILHNEWSHRAGHALLSSRAGHLAEQFELWPGRRDSGTWILSQPGVHCVGMEWSAILPDGRKVTNAKTLTFAVGDPATVTPCAHRAGQPGPPATPDEPGGPPGPPGLAPDRAPRITVAVRTRRLARIAHARGIRLTCRLDRAGSCRARAWLTASRARRLGLRPRKRERVTLGRGAATVRAGSVRSFRVALTRRAGAALARARRPVRIGITVTARVAGRPAASRTIAFTARR
jgi:surface-anchored protein